MSLFSYLDDVSDPRAKRGVRHPAPVILKLVVWGFACGLVTVEHICVAARGIWGDLGPSLGATRSYAPDATTVRLVLGEMDPDELHQAFEKWVSDLVNGKEMIAAVDGKAIRNLSDGEGGVQKVLNVFAHDLKLALSQRLIPADRGESTVLADALKGLFERYPGLAVLTGDSAYSGRSLCQAIKDAGRDYVVQIKGNQKLIADRLKNWFSGTPENRAPDAVLKKKQQAGSAEAMGDARAALQADCSAVQVPQHTANCACAAQLDRRGHEES